MIWKVSYDFERPHWIAYGRIAFVRGESEADARRRAARLVGLLEPDADVRRLDVTPSDWAARLRFWHRVLAQRQWKQNVRRGVQNDPKSL